MAEIKGLFPRAPSVYGRVYEGEEDLILDLVHNTFRRCYFRDCRVIIPDTVSTTMETALNNCQFDDCEVTIIKRAALLKDNVGRMQNDLIYTPIASHIDVKAQPTADKNLITVRLDHALKERLGMPRSIAMLKFLMTKSEVFSFKFR
jgi:hypothetical protein